MKPNFVKCKLIRIGQSLSQNGRYTEFELQDKINSNVSLIKVDESLNRVKTRLKEQYQGDTEQNGIYLSRGMININISTTGCQWDINQEDMNWYVFDKEDVKKFIQ